MQLLIGDWAARTVTENQPTKLAAFEGLEKTTEGASFTLGGVYYDGSTHGGITVPDLLSLLAYHDPNATVQGLDAVPPDDRPPVGVVRNAFTVMVFAGHGDGGARRSSTCTCGGGAGGCRARAGSTARSSPPGRWRCSR